MPATVFDRWMERGARFKATRFCNDPERPSEVVAKRGCRWPDSVHPGNPRIEKLNHRYRRDSPIAQGRRQDRFCNTTRNRVVGRPRLLVYGPTRIAKAVPHD